MCHACLRCRSQHEVPVWSAQHQAFTIIVLVLSGRAWGTWHRTGNSYVRISCWIYDDVWISCWWNVAFNEIITLSKYLSNLPNKFLNILNIDDATNLLHNRIMTQITYEYCLLGFENSLIPPKHTGTKIYDFETRGYNFVYNCEVKTIQSIGDRT